MANVIIRMKDVSKKFGKRLILDKINLEIKSGDIYGIIGQSGSGKTTMLNTLIGFITPDAGDVLFRQEHLLTYGEDETQFKSIFKKSNEVKKTFGFAAQDPSFYKELSVKENLDYFGSLYSMGRDAIKANTNTLLKLMDLSDSADKLGKNLSGGMQKRLDLACALIHDPKVLILDEPTADLDPHLRKQMWNLLKNINSKGTTIILASHFLSEIESLCNRVGILHKGRIYQEGTPDELKAIYSKNEEIHLESTPGNYDKIIKKIKDLDISKIVNKGDKLVIYAPRAEKVLHQVLHCIDDLDERLINLTVMKPTLGEVFETLSKDNHDEDI
jgi:ABC-2 type transport system ATP-binding protein